MSSEAPSRSKKLVALAFAGTVAGAVAGAAVAVPAIAGAQTQSSTTAPDKAQWLTDALQKLVDQGTITQAQAEAVTAAIEAARPAMGPGRGPGPRHLDAAAAAIGIDEAALRDALANGQTIAQVAADHGVDVQAVIDALVADMQSHLADAVAQGRITQERADQMAADAAARAADVVNGVKPAGPPAR
jgi:hypothetical protein